MNKLDKLKKLDEMLLDKMILLMETDETNRLPELTNVISFLKSNQMVEEKKQDDDAVSLRNKKLAEVKARRDGSIK